MNIWKWSSFYLRWTWPLLKQQTAFQNLLTGSLLPEKLRYWLWKTHLSSMYLSLEEEQQEVAVPWMRSPEVSPGVDGCNAGRGFIFPPHVDTNVHQCWKITLLLHFFIFHSLWSSFSFLKYRYLENSKIKCSLSFTLKWVYLKRKLYIPVISLIWCSG